MQAQQSKRCLNSVCGFVLIFFLIAMTMCSDKSNLVGEVFLFTSLGYSITLGESTGHRDLKQLVSSAVKSREKEMYECLCLTSFFHSHAVRAEKILSLMMSASFPFK